MWTTLFAALGPLVTPLPAGLFEAEGLWLVRATAVHVPDHPRLFGDTTLRVDAVLLGPDRLRGTVAVYHFFTPRLEVARGGGARYSGIYPDFAYPAPKGAARYWWARPDRKGDGWTTANFQKLQRYVPSHVSDLLLKFDLKADSPEGQAQAEVVEAVVRLNGQRTRLGQLALLADMKGSRNRYVTAVAEKTLKTLAKEAQRK